MSTYPEHEKLRALNGANRTVGDFIEWLSMQGYVIARFEERGDALVPAMVDRDELIARFFSIDRKKLQDEEKQMLSEVAHELKP